MMARINVLTDLERENSLSGPYIFKQIEKVYESAY